MTTTRRGGSNSGPHRALWFIGLWAAGVLAVGAAAFLVRLILAA